TGTYLGAPEITRLHAGLPASVLLAIDAAYAEFVNRNDYEPGIALVNRAENVVMLRTFSKIYALAGLRLGWAYCPPEIADVLTRKMAAYGLPQHLRITIGTGPEMETVAAALAELMATR